jgi:hypothetical protein
MGKRGNRDSRARELKKPKKTKEASPPERRRSIAQQRSPKPGSTQNRGTA